MWECVNLAGVPRTPFEVVAYDFPDLISFKDARRKYETYETFTTAATAKKPNRIKSVVQKLCVTERDVKPALHEAETILRLALPVTRHYRSGCVCPPCEVRFQRELVEHIRHVTSDSDRPPL